MSGRYWNAGMGYNVYPPNAAQSDAAFRQGHWGMSEAEWNAQLAAATGQVSTKSISDVAADQRR